MAIEMEASHSVNAPRLSVILPVYNGGNYLAAAIRSILHQSFRDFELIIMNDGSKDNSEEVVRSFNDPRIRYFRHENCGLAKTLDKGIAVSKARWIARQDADDISHTDRFEKQMDFLEQHRDVVLLGTRARIFTDDGTTLGYHEHPLTNGLLKFELLFNNPFVHSSVVFSKEVYHRTGGYLQDKQYYEDFHLWSRMASAGRIANLADPLVDYRHHEKGLSKGNAYYSDNALFIQSVMNLEYLLNRKGSDIEDLAALTHGEIRKWKGTPRHAVLKCLKEATALVIKSCPEESTEIAKRSIVYRANILSSMRDINMERFASRPLLRLLVRAENRIQSYLQGVL